MARILRGFILRNTFAVVCVLGYAWVQTPVALGQRGGGGGGHMGGGGGHMGGMSGGGHMGGMGGGMHFGGGGHVAAPHGFAPRSSPAMMRHPRGYPPPAGAGVRSQHFGQHPSRGVNHHAGFSRGFHRFRHGYNYWWPYWWWGYGCPYDWNWGYNCYGYTWPSYGYGYGYDYGSDPPYYNPGVQNVPPTYGYPAYRYDRERRDLTELYLKDGTVYRVSDYWLEDGKIHFRTSDGAVEHALDVDQLDLQTTVDVNTRRGLRFTLSNEPAE